MIIRFKGEWFRICLWRLICDPDRKAIIRHFYEGYKESFIDYWFGFVVLHEQTISGWYEDNDEMWTKTYYVNLIVGRKRKGAFLDRISKELAERIIAYYERNPEKKLFLKLDGPFGGSYQSYHFNRYQTRILVRKLQMALEKEWYVEQ